ncbi:short-chain dehydrogenase [Colletotrichum asianum]|uniref:Short-chain dehydrogenase n=1 Tax=Colletotrichum asianum TaxID=702518 RepID=A0A8H3WDR9_9PEZI|nr:short-chain dehydrogenase [Colletotrichum asianum]
MSAKRVALITGANTGIGYETIKSLLSSGRFYHILLGSRSTDKGAAAAAQLLDDVPSTTSALDRIRSNHGRLDYLVNNAGCALTEPDMSPREAFNAMYNTNVSGQHVVTLTFAPLLIKSDDPRLLFLTSGTAHLARFAEEFWAGEAPAAGWPKPGSHFAPTGYRVSKTALNMLVLAWHWTLRADGVMVWGVSPGQLATNLGGDPGLLKKLGAGDPSLGGQLVRKVLEGERDADAGRIVNRTGVQSW